MNHLKVTGVLLFLLFFSASICYAQYDPSYENQSNEESYSKFNLTAGAGYGTEVEAFGIQVGTIYYFTRTVGAGADVILFFPDNYDWWELNLNGHFKIISEPSFSFYALAGLNYVTLSVDFGQFGSASTSELGGNLGTGIELGTDSVKFFSELKYVLGNADQLGITAGIRFGI